MLEQSLMHGFTTGAGPITLKGRSLLTLIAQSASGLDWSCLAGCEMRHLEGRKVRWASGDEGKGRQHQPSTEKREEKKRAKGGDEGGWEHKPRRSCAEIDGQRGMLWKLNCTKRPTKHHKHCPWHKQQHLARLGVYNIHLRSCCLVTLVYSLCALG